VYAADVNLLRGNTNSMKGNVETLLEASRVIGLEINAEKTKYMIIFRLANSRQKHNIIPNKSFENVAIYKYFRMTLTNKNDFRDEFKNRLKSVNASYYSVQYLLSSRFITNPKIQMYKAVI
jgi:hypothetical protein